MSCCFPGRWISPHFPAQFHLCISYFIFAYHQIPSSLFCHCSSLGHTSLLLYVVNELFFPTCFHLPRLCPSHPQITGCLFLFRVPIFLLRHLWLCPWLSLDPRWTQWVILDLLVLYSCRYIWYVVSPNVIKQANLWLSLNVWRLKVFQLQGGGWLHVAPLILFLCLWYTVPFLAFAR